MNHNLAISSPTGIQSFVAAVHGRHHLVQIVKKRISNLQKEFKIREHKQEEILTNLKLATSLTMNQLRKSPNHSQNLKLMIQSRMRVPILKTQIKETRTSVIVTSKIALRMIILTKALKMMRMRIVLNLTMSSHLGQMILMMKMTTER